MRACSRLNHLRRRPAWRAYNGAVCFFVLLEGVAMRRTLALGCFVGLLSLASAAQTNPSFEIFGGYSFVRVSKAVASPISFDLSDFAFPQQMPSKSMNLNGWEASFTYRRNHLGLVLDTSAHYGSTNSEVECRESFVPCTPTPVEIRLTLQNYILAGPRYYFGGSPVVPFVHALFGYTHFNAHFPPNNAFFASPLKGNGLGIALGGGVDVKIAPHFGYRLFQADYFLTHLNRNTQNNLRASTGLLLKF